MVLVSATHVLVLVSEVPASTTTLIYMTPLPQGGLLNVHSKLDCWLNNSYCSLVRILCLSPKRRRTMLWHHTALLNNCSLVRILCLSPEEMPNNAIIPQSLIEQPQPWKNFMYVLKKASNNVMMAQKATVLIMLVNNRSLVRTLFVSKKLKKAYQIHDGTKLDCTGYVG